MMRGFLAALRFLTILPLPGNFGTAEKDLKRSLAFFPLTGVIIGGGAAGLYLTVHQFLPPALTAVLLILFLVLISGGLHMDGAADTADGFFSARPKERILEIMRDSHVGTMGVLAIIFILAIKITGLASLPPRQAMVTVFLMPLCGRAILVVHMALFPYARSQGGLASPFLLSSSRLQACWSLAVLAACAWLTGQLPALYAILAATLISLLFGFWCLKKINGITGDTLGAACELAETAVAVSFCLI